MIALTLIAILGAAVVLLLVNLNRSDRRIDHLENRLALLSSAFTFETTVNEDGAAVETVTGIAVPVGVSV